MVAVGLESGARAKAVLANELVAGVDSGVVTPPRGVGESERPPTAGAVTDEERLPAAEKAVYTDYTQNHAHS